MNRLLYLTAIYMIFCSSGLNLFAQKGSKIATVVIDAGHGGKDPGALGKSSKEKNVALAVALATGNYIKKYLPDVKVIYTRTDDRFIPLYKRAEIANKNNADFFISIHCNANNNKQAYGSETYTMGLHKSNANLDVAILENAAILFEEDADEQYGGFDVNAPESYIRFTLAQNLYQDQSNLMAYYIQKQFKERVSRRDRGVHQAGFLVLWRTAMPGVLVELGFISNEAEEKFLTSEEGQSYMASAIYRAFKEYKIEFEKENAVIEEFEAIREEIIEEKKEEGLTYRVQFYTSPKEIPVSDARFEGIPDVSVYQHNGLFKYTAGIFETNTQAKQLLISVREKGYSDAFVAAFLNDERIGMDRAREIESSR